MTTAKAAAANKANSKKSTGAITPEGKATVSKNAVKHGLLSQMLIIAGEDIQDFNTLLARLMQSIAPDGMLEQVLVEKVAVALWRQKRLVTAESAAIELNRRLEYEPNQNAINKALGLSWNIHGDSRIKPEELEPTENDQEHLTWCKDVMAEFEALDDAVLVADMLDRLANEAPLLFEELSAGAIAEEQDLKAYTSGKLEELANDTYQYCKDVMDSKKRKESIHEVAKLVQLTVSAPSSNELLARYSTGLDNELYRAIEQLRKQQEFRLKRGVIVNIEEAA